MIIITFNPASLEKVVTSTSVQLLTGQDKEPEKYELFKFYRDRYMLDEARPMVDRWLKKEESKWLAKYLLAKYYGDIENALEVVKHRFSRNRIPVLKDFVDFIKPEITYKYSDFIFALHQMRDRP